MTALLPTRGRIVHVVTVPESLKFIDTLVDVSVRRGMSVTVVSSPGPTLDAFAQRFEVDAVELPLTRRISPSLDARALDACYRLLRARRPDIVHGHTPKGGLVAMLAAKAAGIATRIYHLRGLPFVTRHGVMRAILAGTDSCAMRSATHVIAQSPSLRHTALTHHLVESEKCRVIRRGSNGVDADAFSRARHAAAGTALRTRLGIPLDAFVIAFVGRMVRDKGVAQLVEAFETLAASPTPWLLLAGASESADALPGALVARIAAHPRIRVLGHLDDVRPVYAASDVLALPSFREGFPNVALEAQAMELPVVATRIDGCVDAIVDRTTGLLVEAGDVATLAAALARYADSPQLRAAHGAAGRARVVEVFQRSAIAEDIVALYEAALSSARGARATRSSRRESALAAR